MAIGRRPSIERAENDLLYDEDGRRHIDMFSANGTAWLGHANPAVTARVAEQLGRVWVTGALDTRVRREAKAAIEGFFPASHALAGLCSTGMESAEFAMRIARVVTRRNGVVGFENSMHGKSLATAYLGWDNKDRVELPGFHRLPFVGICPEGEILERLRGILAGQAVSAVFVEPLQGTGGGHMASKRFYEEVYRLCRERDALLVFDEILTGFYRTGSAFFFSDLGFVPDVVLIGKAMGNGFPVSGVVVDRKYAIRREMLPGSTYAGNALASAAVVATLREMRSMALPEKVAGIEKTVLEHLGSLREMGVVLRGKGAVWIVELPPGPDVEEIVTNIFRRGVLVGYTGRRIRILPPATIEPGNLEKACAVVREELSEALRRR